MHEVYKNGFVFRAECVNTCFITCKNVTERVSFWPMKAMIDRSSSHSGAKAVDAKCLNINTLSPGDDLSRLLQMKYTLIRQS